MGNDLQTTDKVQELQRKLYQKAKSEVNFRFYLLYDKVYRMDVLRKAWDKVRENRGAAGIDGQGIEDIKRLGVEDYLLAIQEELKARTYRPKPARRSYIPKPDGTKRALSIPTVKDRIVQTALRLVIEPIFEADFEDTSYGYRPKRSGQDAAREVQKLLNYGYEEVIETDVEDCFGSIPHKELLDMIAKRIVDGKILWLIKLFLKAGVMEEDDIQKDDKGTPQGGSISPLLANIYLDNIDKKWRPINSTARIIRYADDILIVSKYKAEGYKMKLERIIRSMKLRLKDKKTRIINARKQTFDFLGFTFMKKPSRRDGKVRAYYMPSAKAVKTIKKKVREVVNHKRPVKVEDIVKELAPVVGGWVNYFRMANSSERFGEVKEYVAQRVRKFMRRRRNEKGYGYKEYSNKYLYETLSLYRNYRVSWMKAI